MPMNTSQNREIEPQRYKGTKRNSCIPLLCLCAFVVNSSFPFAGFGRGSQPLISLPRSLYARGIRVALLVLALALVLPAGATIAAPLGGTLTGKLTMKTAGVNLPATPVTIDLLFYNPGFFRINDESVDFKETTTAPDGSFTFAGLDTSPAGVYRVVARYKGARFEPMPRDFTDANGQTAKTSAVRFEANATTATIEVPLAEPAASTYQTGFTVASHSVVINELRPQFYSIVEAYQFQNDTDRALVASLKPDGTVDEGVPVVFSLPMGATEITTNRTDLLATTDLTGQKLTLKTPITPGSSDITCTYTLPGGSAGLTYTRTLDYATTKLEVLISDSKQPVNPGTVLKLDTPIQPGQASTPFKRLNANNVPQGQAIQLLIGPSPPTPTGTATPATDNRNVIERIRSGISSPALLALAALCLVLMVVILRLPAKPIPAKPGKTPASGGSKSTRTKPEPPPLATKAEATSTPATKTPPKRASRGRPPDAVIDADEAEIEAANKEL